MENTRLQKDHDKAVRNGLGEEDAWELAYKKESMRKVTQAEKYYKRGMDLGQISKKTGLSIEYLQKKLVYKEE